MRDYPPEYDDYCAAEVKVDEKPDWIDAFFWGEDGKVFYTCKHEDRTVTIAEDVEGDDEDAAKPVVLKWLEAYATKNSELCQRIYAAEKAKPKKAPESWDEFWDGMKQFMPDGTDFEKPDTVFFDYFEAGDWQPEFCDDCNTYHQYAYDYKYGRDEDGTLYIEVGTCDSDGDWDYSTFYESEWDYLYRDYLCPDNYFLAWANYYQWCHAEGKLDPLDDLYNRRDLTIEGMAEACEDNLKYLEK